MACPTPSPDWDSLSPQRGKMRLLTLMTRRTYGGLAGAALTGSALGIADPAPEADAADDSRAARMKWWHDARFGMFIHWGLYSVVGRHEWVMEDEGIPVAEYEELAKRFAPKPN